MNKLFIFVFFLFFFFKNRYILPIPKQKNQRKHHSTKRKGVGLLFDPVQTDENDDKADDSLLSSSSSSTTASASSSLLSKGDQLRFQTFNNNSRWSRQQQTNAAVQLDHAQLAVRVGAVHFAFSYNDFVLAYNIVSRLAATLISIGGVVDSAQQHVAAAAALSATHAASSLLQPSLDTDDSSEQEDTPYDTEQSSASVAKSEEQSSSGAHVWQWRRFFRRSETNNAQQNDKTALDQAKSTGLAAIIEDSNVIFFLNFSGEKINVLCVSPFNSPKMWLN